MENVEQGQQEMGVREIFERTTKRESFAPPITDLIRAGFWMAVGWLIVFPVVMVLVAIAAMTIMAGFGSTL